MKTTAQTILGEVGVTWAVATSTKTGDATFCADQSEGATWTGLMNHLGSQGIEPCDWRGRYALEDVIGEDVARGQN